MLERLSTKRHEKKGNKLVPNCVAVGKNKKRK
jgi:hypothetical protein